MIVAKDPLTLQNEIINASPTKKIIFLGDIKHSFSFEHEEKFDFREILDFLKQHIKEENIIFIRGNHDTIDYTFKNKIRDLYIEDNIVFIHGHKAFPEIYDKKIKTIIMGHIHPSILLHDKHTIKKEKYKVFLTGKYKNKNIIILPSFLGISIGSPINYNEEFYYEDNFLIIPKNILINFKIHAIEKDKIYDFGKVKDL